MKTIIIIILAIIVSLVIIGGGLGAFISNVGEGTEKIKQNEQVQEITSKISSKLNPDKVVKSESAVIQDKPVETQASQNNCDSSYPDVCIAPYPPDLDCGEISYKNFRVLSPDPHRFDGDHDGIGCEK